MLLAALAALTLPAGLGAQAPDDARVILVTFDGVRTAEFFGGLDSSIALHKDASGVDDPARLLRDYDAPDAVSRRRRLMPFFWDSLAPRGIVLGDPALGGGVTITNPHGFSAPGYFEILTGQAQPDVTSNDLRRYPHRTVLEHVRDRLGLPPERVAAFASWENFRAYVASRDGAVFVNAGFDTLPTADRTPALDGLVRLQARAVPPWHGARLDAFTGALALEWLRTRDPRVLYIAFNDTDDQAHPRRYDGVLDALHGLDDFLRELWQTVESLPAYRGRTTLVLTTDHGRGRTGRDWTDHGAEVPGARDIWLAVIGPRTPARGDVSGSATQAQVAATLLAALGLPAGHWQPGAAGPVAAVCGDTC